MTARRWLTAVLVLALSGGVVAAPAQAVPEVDKSDSSANRSRTFEAYDDDIGRIFEVFFTTTVPGETRQVRAVVNVEMPSTATDDLLEAHAVVWCSSVAGDYGVGGVNKIAQDSNVMRGGTLRLTPRFLWTASTPGPQKCMLRLSSTRPRPAGTNPSSNVWHAVSGSTLEVTHRIEQTPGQSYTPADGRRVSVGNSYDTAELAWTAPAGVTEFTATGDAWVTACTYSSDEHGLCTYHWDRTGSKVHVRLVIAHYGTLTTAIP